MCLILRTVQLIDQLNNVHNSFEIQVRLDVVRGVPIAVTQWLGRGPVSYYRLSPPSRIKSPGDSLSLIWDGRERFPHDEQSQNSPPTHPPTPGGEQRPGIELTLLLPCRAYFSAPFENTNLDSKFIMISFVNCRKTLMRHIYSFINMKCMSYSQVIFINSFLKDP